MIQIFDLQDSAVPTYKIIDIDRKSRFRFKDQENSHYSYNFTSTANLRHIDLYCWSIKMIKSALLKLWFSVIVSEMLRRFPQCINLKRLDVTCEGKSKVFG